jgi:hypothetical protein
MTKRSRSRGDDGDATLELLILAPVILALIALLVAAGRTSVAQGAVQAAARDALRQDSLDCRPVVTVDTAGFGVPVGQPAHVSASVTCTVRLSDLLVPGLPGSKTLRASFTSPLDPYRSR